jgi:hypothetical protein
MVNIELPIHIGVDTFQSSIEVLGIRLQYKETPVQLKTTLVNKIAVFRNSFQFKEGVPQDTVNVVIQQKDVLLEHMVDIFKYNMFTTDMSVEQPFVDHLSEALAVELSKYLGLNAIASTVTIPMTDEVLMSLSQSILQEFESSQYLRQFLYEQYLAQSPERFPPGKNDVYAAIPFEVEDTISFFLTVKFENAIINGNSSLPLSMFLTSAEQPVVKFVVQFSFSS